MDPNGTTPEAQRLKEARRLIRTASAQSRRLEKAEAAYRDAVTQAEALRLKRNAAVLAALDAGMTQGEVARITGLVRPRIGQILKAATEATQTNEEAPTPGPAARGATTHGGTREQPAKR